MVDLGKIASTGKETVIVGVDKLKGLFLNGKIEKSLYLKNFINLVYCTN